MLITRCWVYQCEEKEYAAYQNLLTCNYLQEVDVALCMYSSQVNSSRGLLIDANHGNSARIHMYIYIGTKPPACFSLNNYYLYRAEVGVEPLCSWPVGHIPNNVDGVMLLRASC